jgi:hypothetical protein
MQKYLCILLWTAAWLVPGAVCAQDTLRFSPHLLIGVKDTVVEGSAVSDSVYLHNAGPTTNGPIGFVTGIEDSVTHAITIVRTDSFVGTALAANSTRIFHLNRLYSTGYTNPSGIFRTGNNVVVIWPICSSVSSNDTLRHTIYIKRKILFPAQFASDSAYLYPNPTNDRVFIRTRQDTKTSLSATTVYDLAGKVVLMLGSQTEFNVSELQKGIYLVTMQFSNGSRETTRLAVW